MRVASLMASTGQLKRRLSGPAEKRSSRLSSSPQLAGAWSQTDSTGASVDTVSCLGFVAFLHTVLD